MIEDLAAQNSTFKEVISILEGNDSQNTTQISMVARAGIAQRLNYLQSYGCWCHLDEEHGKGHGSPVDGYDEACKKLHEGVTCAKKEVKTLAGETCIPAETIYQVDAQIATDGKLVYNCETFNTDPCAVNTCYLETHFLSLVLDQALKYRYVPRYEQYSHMDLSQCGGRKIVDYNDYYDYDGGLAGMQTARTDGFRNFGMDDVVKYTKCCGEYSANTKRPIQFTDRNERQCCENPMTKDFIVYNTINHECCRDGSIRNVGSCSML